MSNKAYVRRKIPKSFAHRWVGCWEIYRPMSDCVKGLCGNETIGTGASPALAWKNAAERLKAKQNG